MRKLIAVLILSFLVFNFSSSVLAQSPSPKSRQTEKRVEKMEEVGDRFSAVRRERIANFSNRMVIKLEALIERLEKLIERIETRIKKIEESNSDINLTDAKEDLALAKKDLEDTKAEFTALKGKLDEIINEDNPKEAFKQVRVQFRLVMENLRGVHANLVKLIGDIKGLRVGNK